MCFMRLAPAVMEFGHTRNCSESLTRLSLQLLAVVGGVVGQRNCKRGGIMFLGPDIVLYYNVLKFREKKRKNIILLHDKSKRKPKILIHKYLKSFCRPVVICLVKFYFHILPFENVHTLCVEVLWRKNN